MQVPSAHDSSLIFDALIGIAFTLGTSHSITKADVCSLTRSRPCGEAAALRPFRTIGPSRAHFCLSGARQTASKSAGGLTAGSISIICWWVWWADSGRCTSTAAGLAFHEIPWLSLAQASSCGSEGWSFEQGIRSGFSGHRHFRNGIHQKCWICSSNCSRMSFSFRFSTSVSSFFLQLSS